MIRALVISIGLILGLAIAAITQGRVAHFRFLDNDKLPEWTHALSPDSGLLQGSVMEVVPNTSTEWQFIGIALGGLMYQVRFIGDGISVHIIVTAAWDRRTAEFSQMRGEVDLDIIHPQAKRIGLSGKLYLEDMTGSVDYEYKRIQSLSGNMILREIRFDSTALDNLTIMLSPSEVDVWLAQLNVNDGTLLLNLNARGQFGQSTAQIDGIITEGSDMPDGWRRILDQSLPKTADGWQVNQPIDLNNPVIGR